MRGLSAASELRRCPASPRDCCARGALALILGIGLLPYWLRAEGPSLPPPIPPQSAGISPSVPPLAVTPTPPGALAAGVAGPKPAAPPRESDDLDAALQRRGDLNLHGLSLNTALFTIGEQWNINIVAGDLSGTVNGVFRQAPLREILDSILLSNGYNYRVVGKSLVISKTEELGKINPFFQSATISVQSADIDEVVEGARLLSTPQGQVRPLKSAHSIVVLDFPDRVQMIRQFVTAVDGANSHGVAATPETRAGRTLEVAQFRTQHIKVAAAAIALQPIISPEGHVAIMEKDDRLIITDHIENLAMAEKVLVRVDQPRPQVRITALIYDVSLQDLEQLGLKWDALSATSGSTTVGIAKSATPFDTLDVADGAIKSASAGTGNIAFGVLAHDFNIAGVCLALQEAKDSRLLADPNVAVLENETATFRSVRELPIQQLTQTQQGGQIGTTAFRDAGVKLTVIPKVASDGTICMDVAPEFSRLVEYDGKGQPVIDTREAKTTLRVANRQTVVIAGLRQREDIGDFSGIPYLKDMKYIGRFFRSRSTTVRESELIVFLMPEIISEAEPLDCRNQAAADTINCRLDQIPRGEGCPACFRRLPVETAPADVPASPEEPLPENSSPNGSGEAPPRSAAQIPSSEFQFGAAGRSRQVRAMVADGRLRRLPTVDSDADSAPQPDIHTANAPSATLKR